MRPPPPLSQIQYFPVTGGTALLAIVATVASWMHYSTAPLEMSYLAFHGQPWRLITCAFPHADILHIAFNLYWMWVLGSIVEARFGHMRTAALYVLLAAGSSAPEYAFSVGGIGLSGVVYGIFGFLWVLGRSDPRLKDAVDPQTTQLFVIWFFICIALTVTNIMPIGNYAHGAGVILGALVGWIVQRGPEGSRFNTRLPAAIGLALMLGATLWAATIGRPLVNFSPDGSDDVYNLGTEALQSGDNVKALHLLEIAASMRHAPADCFINLGIAAERLGRNDEAGAAFQRADQLKSKK